MNDERYSWRPILALSFIVQGIEIVARGMDELHLQEVCNAICHDHGEGFDGKPEVILLETIRKTADAEGKYIRQTGGSGNYGHVKLRLEPRPEGTGFKFSSQVPNSLLSEEYASAVEVGVREAAGGGVLFGHELVDLQATPFDASVHETDSNAMAFQIAGSIAFKEAARKASPVLLEPMMAVEFMVDVADVPEAVSQLNARRGRIESMEPYEGFMEIVAIVPLSEALTSSKHGRPDYQMQFARYEPTWRPPENSGENGPGVRSNLPKFPHLRSRYAAAQPDIEFDL